MAINVAIITIDEPFYIPKMINNFLALAPMDIKCVLIVVVPVKPHKFSTWGFISNQLKVFGISQFMKIGLLYMLNKFLAAQKSGEKYSVKKIARKNQIDLIKTDTLKDPVILEILGRYPIDVILSVASSRILGKAMISIPKIACLNVHAGRLPKYRGINPSFWSLLNREKMSAVTVHYINEKIDDGDIIIQEVFNIENAKSLHDVYLKVVDITPTAVIKALESIKNGNVQITKNDRLISSYYSFPDKDDGLRFRKMGLKFI